MGLYDTGTVGSIVWSHFSFIHLYITVIEVYNLSSEFFINLSTTPVVVHDF
jgi:hypothetical protein